MEGRKTPKQWHEKRHHRSFLAGISYEDCWYCQRMLAHCKSKIRWETGDEAREAALDFNIERDWVNPLYAYRCRNCEAWHTATARDKHSKRKAERQRRKWILGRLQNERPSVRSLS